MSILSDLNPLTAIEDIGGKLIDHFFPDPNEAAEKKIELAKLAQQGDFKELDTFKALATAQAAINQAEASSGNPFAADWRPFVGYVCGVAFAYAFVLQPFLQFVIVAFGIHLDVSKLPDLNISEMMPVLLGMLGLGGMHSFEKVKGGAK